ncbi:MAG: NRDE family protein [Syntrophomonadaceae bacterium]|nr:NRDE family protein [Syntrophomonadaceae bacterium]
MCLILLAYDCHPQYWLAAAANRDEFYNRQTLPAAFWPEEPSILAGRDLEQGGTWMGITTAGQFAALTNYRDPSRNKPQAPSRGHLVQEYLSGSSSPEYYLQNLLDEAELYNGFNLLAGSLEALYYLSNREQVIRRLDRGYHGISNSLINVPWPKVTKGIKGLAASLSGHEANWEELFALMADKELARDVDLPQTGVSLEMERQLSSIFIEMPQYGTRSTTVMLIDRENRVQFRERSFTPENSETWQEVGYSFRIGDYKE